MSSIETKLQEAQDDALESHRLQEVDLLESLNFQEELYSPLEPLSLSDDLKNESFDLKEANTDLEDPMGLYDNQKIPLIKAENDDLLQSFSEQEDMNEYYSLQKPGALQDNIQDPSYLFEAQLDLQDPLYLMRDPPSPKEDGPDSLEWDSLLEPLSINQDDLKDALIIQKDIKGLPSLKKYHQDLHGFEWDHLDESITLQDENIQQSFSRKYSLPEQNIVTDRDTHGTLSMQEFGSSHYSSPLGLSKSTLGLNEDDNGPKEYYGPERPNSEGYASMNTSMRPKFIQKNNKLKKFNHYLVEFDEDEVVVEKFNALNNNEDNSESSYMQKRKTEKKRKSLSRKAKMYVTSEMFKKGENKDLSKQPNLMSKNSIPEIVDISKSSENPKRTKVVIKGLDNMKKSDITGVLGHLSNYITDNAISTALNEHTYFNKSKTKHSKDIKNYSHSNLQSNILQKLVLQGGLLTLNEILDQGVLDITNQATVQLAQILTFSIYFHKNIREITQAAWQSQPVATLTSTVQEIAHEVPAHLALGTSLVALSDQMEGTNLDETWLGLGCLALTYLYQVARSNRKLKDSKQKVEQKL